MQLHHGICIRFFSECCTGFAVERANVRCVLHEKVWVNVLQAGGAGAGNPLITIIQIIITWFLFSYVEHVSSSPQSGRCSPRRSGSGAFGSRRVCGKEVLGRRYLPAGDFRYRFLDCLKCWIQKLTVALPPAELYIDQDKKTFKGLNFNRFSLFSLPGLLLAKVARDAASLVIF